MSSTQSTILLLLVIATLAPLLSSTFLLLFGKKLGQLSAWIATFVMGGCFIASGVALVMWVSAEPGTILWNIPWIPLPGLDAGWLARGVLIDGLTIAMMTMVTMIATLVHLYSIGYMQGDKRFSRFFAYLSLFTFSMLGIVTANGLMQLFVFWELVGLTSYL